MKGVARAFTCLAILACSHSELRGQWKQSEDGKTYLVIAESPGCDHFRVNGKRWPHALGARGAVAPGVTRIGCLDGSNEIRFEVKRGTTFRFDYWGP